MVAFLGASGDSLSAQDLTPLRFTADIRGFGFGVPGNQNSRGYAGAFVFTNTQNGLRVTVPTGFVGVTGNGPNTTIGIYFDNGRYDFIEFDDYAAVLNSMGREGTALVDPTKAGGAYRGSGGSFTYTFGCGQGCFLGGGTPRPASFDFHLTGSGELIVPTSAVQKVSPRLFPPPPADPSWFDQWINGKVQMMGGPPADGTTPGLTIPRDKSGLSSKAATSGNSRTLMVTSGMQFAATNYQAQTSCPNLSTCWLSASSPSGSIAPFTSLSLPLNVNSGNLAPGVYPANIALTMTPTDGSSGPFTQNVGANLVITSGAPMLQLSESAIPFQAIPAAKQTPLTHVIALTNSSFYSSAALPLPFQATASTLSGGNWLSVTPGLGSASVQTPAPLTIAADPSGLAVGTYFGRIDIHAASASTATQSVIVELNVTAPAAGPPSFSSTGLIFVQNATPPASQVLRVNTLSSQPITITPGAEEDDGNTWLQVTASSNNLTAAQAVTQTVAMNTQGLAAGLHTGNVYEATSGGVAYYPIPVDLIVKPSGTCTATQLAAVITNLAAGFELPAAQPVSLQAQIVDDCGVPLTAGAVQATFSTHDPPVLLSTAGNGLWTGTWMPHNAAGGPANVTIAAQSASGLQGSVSVNGTLDANASAPIVSPGGIVNAASLISGDPVSPGQFVSIFGSNLAPSGQAASTTPFPTTLNGTRVFLGGVALSLSYAGPGQINALMPAGAPPNTWQQLVVQQGSSYAMPETVLVSAANPAVFTQDGSGKGAGAIQVAKTDGTVVLNTPSAPSHAGDALVIYCTGLGAVSPAVLDGAVTPSTGLTQTISPVTVSIGGQTLQPFFAGLTPGYVGLYQVNVILPAGIATGSAVPVTVITQGFPSATVTASIQ